jgi:RND family efflux transporter MFP subunit
MNTPSFLRKHLALAVATLLLAAGGATTLLVHAQDGKAPAAAAPRPALTVTVTTPQRATVATSVAANGNIAAWQEAIVGAESNGMRLAEVLVNVGDAVRKGQVLARFDTAMANADLAQSRAAVAEAEANLAEAAANAQRARDLQPSGALSAQQVAQLLTAERTAQARLEAVKAAQQVQQLRLEQAQVLAPDSGVISARSATVGAVVPAGSELFRLIRQGRLEWRGEVAATELAQIRRGQTVSLGASGAGVPVTGTVRQVAPTVDAATRNALVYVDLPDTGGRLKAGMFARGEFATGSSTALTLPQAAVLLRDGFSYVFAVSADNRVAQIKVSTGRRSGDRIEILQGLDDKARVVASGGGFLADGDTVRVVATAPAAPAGKTTASK